MLGSHAHASLQPFYLHRTTIFSTTPTSTNNASDSTAISKIAANTMSVRNEFFISST